MTHEGRLTPTHSDRLTDSDDLITQMTYKLNLSSEEFPEILNGTCIFLLFSIHDTALRFIQST